MPPRFGISSANAGQVRTTSIASPATNDRCIAVSPCGPDRRMRTGSGQCHGGFISGRPRMITPVHRKGAQIRRVFQICATLKVAIAGADNER